MTSRNKVQSMQSCSIVCAARYVTGAAMAWRCSCYRQLVFGMAVRLQAQWLLYVPHSGHYMYQQV